MFVRGEAAIARCGGGAGVEDIPFEDRNGRVEGAEGFIDMGEARCLGFKKGESVFLDVELGRAGLEGFPGEIGIGFHVGEGGEKDAARAKQWQEGGVGRTGGGRGVEVGTEVAVEGTEEGVFKQIDGSVFFNEDVDPLAEAGVLGRGQLAQGGITEIEEGEAVGAG